MGLLGDVVGCWNRFGFGRLKSKLRRLTDRQYLVILCVLVFLCSLYLCLIGAGIVVAFNHDFRGGKGTNTGEERTSTSTYIVQVGLGGYLVMISVLGISAARKVNIVWLIRYYWLSLVSIPLLFLFSVVVLDFKDLLSGWISHRWENKEFDFLRKYFCEKDADGYETWDTKCKAPISGGPLYQTTDQWCRTNYDNATDCAEIRAKAERAFVKMMGTFMNVNGIVGIVDMFFLLASLKLVERTLTLPVIMSSMLDAINWLLLLPVAFCILIGLIFNQHEKLEVNDAWLKNIFFVSGGSLFLLLSLGIFASREKLRGVLRFYLFVMSMLVCLLGFACGSSFILAWKIQEIYGISGQGRVGEVACESNLVGCCCCDQENLEDDELCPEWSREEIIHIIEADFKLAGLVASISCLFAIRATRACYILVHNLKDYKCVYI